MYHLNKSKVFIHSYETHFMYVIGDFYANIANKKPSGLDPLLVTCQIGTVKLGL